eukprot:TRINITY_DN9665_c0_g1_i1.p1 TRINITY_DN9665_c0_g1~~TRINITY_DN9665_c0_g1_i1.p1  ORF type:complete len:317 (-),score=45.04 TRINITY_DN9665_c0_g1_i1:572-1522(-)
MHNKVILLCGLIVTTLGCSSPFGQLILAYYSGIGIDTIGSGGLNALSMAFFAPGPMATSPSCDFTNPQTPCLQPAAGAGPSLGQRWAVQTINTSIPLLKPNSPLSKPTLLFAFGGQSEGGASWDQIFSSPQQATTFGTNCAKLVLTISKLFGDTAFIGIDLDIEGTQTSLPYFQSFMSSFRSLASPGLYPLQLDSLSGLASASNPDHFKVGIMENFGPSQGGISFLNMMVDNVAASCETMSGYWRDSRLDFVPPCNKVLGFWGENLSAWILKNPGCTDGTSPLFPWMKTNGAGMGIWQWWAGATDDITAVILQVRQ